jgi:hypothetical protein
MTIYTCYNVILIWLVLYPVGQNPLSDQMNRNKLKLKLKSSGICNQRWIYGIYNKKWHIEVADRSGQTGGVCGGKWDANKSSKAVSFTRAWVKDPLNYSLLDQVIPEASGCKYLGIILFSDLSWIDRVNYAVKKAWKHFISQCVFLKKQPIIQKVYLHFTSASSSRVWGCLLGSIQGGTDNCIRLGTKESSKILISYKRF